MYEFWFNCMSEAYFFGVFLIKKLQTLFLFRRHISDVCQYVWIYEKHTIPAIVMQGLISLIAVI